MPRKAKNDVHPAQLFNWYMDTRDGELEEAGEFLTDLDGWEDFTINQRVFLYARTEFSTHPETLRAVGLSEPWFQRNRGKNQGFRDAVELAKEQGGTHGDPRTVLKGKAKMFVRRTMAGATKQTDVKMSDRPTAAKIILSLPHKDESPTKSKPAMEDDYFDGPVDFGIRSTGGTATD